MSGQAGPATVPASSAGHTELANALAEVLGGLSVSLSGCGASAAADNHVPYLLASTAPMIAPVALPLLSIIRLVTLPTLCSEGS